MQLLTNPLLKSCFKIAGLWRRIPRRSQFVFHISNDDVLIKEEYFEISISVLQEHKTAVKMLFPTIPKVPINCPNKPGYSRDDCKGKRD